VADRVPDHSVLDRKRDVWHTYSWD
jgi:hypothetical protein